MYSYVVRYVPIPVCTYQKKTATTKGVCDVVVVDDDSVGTGSEMQFDEERKRTAAAARSFVAALRRPLLWHCVDVDT